MKPETIQIKLCCGCGNVNLSIGSLMLKISKNELLELSSKLNQVVEDLESTERANPPLHLFADRKFF